MLMRIILQFLHWFHDLKALSKISAFVFVGWKPSCDSVWWSGDDCCWAYR